jgi:hypothetical protein
MKWKSNLQTCLIMFINFFLNSEVPATLKCNPSLGAYKEETGRLFNKKKKNYNIYLYTVPFFECIFFKFQIYFIIPPR